MRVKRQLQCIWHITNTYLDLLALHKEVVDLRNAKPLSFDAASIANDILKKLQAIFPTCSSFTSLLLDLDFMILLNLRRIWFYDPFNSMSVTSSFERKHHSFYRCQAKLHKFKLQRLP